MIPKQCPECKSGDDLEAQFTITTTRKIRNGQLVDEPANDDTYLDLFSCTMCGHEWCAGPLPDTGVQVDLSEAIGSTS